MDSDLMENGTFRESLIPDTHYLDCCQAALHCCAHSLYCTVLYILARLI